MDYLTRLKEEQKQLQERLDKLQAFLDTGKVANLSKEQQHWLPRQITAMIEYNRCLKQRLKDIKNG